MNYEVGQYIKVMEPVATVCQIMNTNDILTFRGNETADCSHSKSGFDIFNELFKKVRMRKSSRNSLSGEFEMNFKKTAKNSKLITFTKK